MHHARARLAGLTVVAVLLGACASDGEETADTAEPTTTASTETSELQAVEESASESTPSEVASPEAPSTAPSAPALGSLDQGGTIDGSTFRNDELGYALEYPAEWTVSQDEFGADAFGFEPPAEGSSFANNISVVVQDAPGDVTLDQVESQTLQQLPAAITDFELVESSREQLAGEEALRLDYTGRQGENDIRFVQYLLLPGERTYVLTLAATQAGFDAVQPAAQQVFDSFELL